MRDKGILSEAEKRSSGQLINYVGGKAQEQKLQKQAESTVSI